MNKLTCMVCKIERKVGDCGNIYAIITWSRRMDAREVAVSKDYRKLYMICFDSKRLSLGNTAIVSLLKRVSSLCKLLIYCAGIYCSKSYNSISYSTPYIKELSYFKTMDSVAIHYIYIN